jgi:Glucose dehydrogenase
VKRICLLVLLVTLLGVRSRPVFTQTSAELLNTSRTTENITTESMGYDRKNYSPLKQINTSNVKRLVPIWNSSLMNDLGELAAPVVTTASCT